MIGGNFVRKLWARIWLRRSQFSGRYGQLKALYAIDDPWNLSSGKERERHLRMNTLIAEVAPGCGWLLELGAGEGFQTQHLQAVSRRVVGLEISDQAVKRARVRCPDVEFIVGPAEDAASLLAGRRFDVITAFEVLYYAPDIASMLASLQTMTPVIVVTNYMDLAQKMGSLFEGPGWERREDLTLEGVTWRIDVWRA